MHISADAATDRAIESGDRVRVSTRFGTVDAIATVDPTLAPRTVWVSHGWLQQNVHRLVDPDPDLMTAQPTFTRFPIALERV